jgi:hypothetical protein
VVTFGEVLAFDAEKVAEIFKICSAQQQSCSTLSEALKRLDDLQTWQGDSAAAARRAAARRRVDISAHGDEYRKVAAAARDCYHEGLLITQEAIGIQSEANAADLAIDPTTGAVTGSNPPGMGDWSAKDKRSYLENILDLQRRVTALLTWAERFDDNLAVLLDAAGGELPLSDSRESPDFNPAAKAANQFAAFREIYGRDPVSDNDWRLAEMVDPHSYDPKNKGEPPVISAIRIKPVPGQGVVSTGLFIPSEKVKGGYHEHKGDNRGFDTNFDAEDTRISYVIDYENGYVIARQNPSVNADTGEVKTGTPYVGVAQLGDGSVVVDYDAADPLAPAAAAAVGWSVNGTTVFTPGDDGVRVSGNVTDYPSMETYQYTPQGQTQTLHQDDAGDRTEWGPSVFLPGDHEFGNYDDDIDRFPEQMKDHPKAGPLPTGSPATTRLGDVTDPPAVRGLR